MSRGMYERKGARKPGYRTPLNALPVLRSAHQVRKSETALGSPAWRWSGASLQALSVSVDLPSGDVVGQVGDDDPFIARAAAGSGDATETCRSRRLGADPRLPVAAAQNNSDSWTVRTPCRVASGPSGPRPSPRNRAATDKRRQPALLNVRGAGQPLRQPCSIDRLAAHAFLSRGYATSPPAVRTALEHGQPEGVYLASSGENLGRLRIAQIAPQPPHGPHPEIEAEPPPGSERRRHGL